MVQVEIIETPELGDRSYVAHDGTAAVVIDPQRDLDRVQVVLAANGLTCGLVVETHVHNDYLTGGCELARRTGAPHAVAADDEVSYQRRPVRDGDELSVGSMTVRVVGTPGHTDAHLAYVVSDAAGAAVFTGGSLLYGSVGRTDLVDPARTDELTRAQYRSARRLAELLPDATPVYPTHGFGSFCSSGSPSGAGAAGATIGTERGRNDALTEDDEDAFVRHLVAGLTAYPAYYAHMSALNRQGPGPADLSPVTELDAAEVRRRIDAGEWVVDLGARAAFARRHLTGSIGIALGDQFATYLGWVMPWGTPLTLIGETAEQVAAAQRQLVRIGIDRPAGAAVGPIGDGDDSSYLRVTFAELAADAAGDIVLDVRRDDERAKGAIPGSAHVPLHALLTRLDNVPAGRLWVHCATGFRASIAASLLDRAGREVVYIDDDYTVAVASGLATG